MAVTDQATRLVTGLNYLRLFGTTRSLPRINKNNTVSLVSKIPSGGKKILGAADITYLEKFGWKKEPGDWFVFNL